MSAIVEEIEEGVLDFMRLDDSSEDEDQLVLLKYDTYDMKISADGHIKTFTLALTAKHHSLWAEYIYNASRILADLMVDRSNPNFIDVCDKKCLELGAGAGLPGFIAGICGAKEVVITDFGHDNDLSLIYPIDINIQQLRREVGPTPQAFYAMGYVWGSPVHPLIRGEQFYHSSECDINCDTYEGYVRSKINAREKADNTLSFPTLDDDEKFDVEILADLIFNRSQHERLLKTVKESLKPKSGLCYVTFSHHDPAKRDMDLNFFSLAQSEPFNFEVTFVHQEQRKSYPFTENDGLDEARGVVHLCILRIP